MGEPRICSSVGTDPPDELSDEGGEGDPRASVGRGGRLLAGGMEEGVERPAGSGGSCLTVFVEKARLRVATPSADEFKLLLLLSWAGVSGNEARGGRGGLRAAVPGEAGGEPGITSGGNTQTADINIGEEGGSCVRGDVGSDNEGDNERRRVVLLLLNGGNGLLGGPRAGDGVGGVVGRWDRTELGREGGGGMKMDGGGRY
jgi:hypothetical protein